MIFLSEICTYLTAPVQITLLIVIVFILRKFFKRQKVVEPKEEEQGNELPPMEKRDFTLLEIRKYNGKDDPRILIAVNGKVFDVTKGKDFYGPDILFPSPTLSVPCVTHYHHQRFLSPTFDHPLISHVSSPQPTSTYPASMSLLPSSSHTLQLPLSTALVQSHQKPSSYERGGPYGVFAGCDASRCFATFSTDPKTIKDGYDDLSDLNSMQMESLLEWEMQFSEKYVYVGKLLKPGETHSNYNAEESEDEIKSEGEKKVD